jgi:AcrR family transcriptional regulator
MERAAKGGRADPLSEQPGSSIVTPWGKTSELRTRKLIPGSGTPRAEVLRNQRERLFAAVVAEASERGYQEMTVAHVIEVCGISRSDFYKHFANKADCLTQAAESLLEPTRRELEEVRAAADARAPEAVLLKFLELVAAQPAAARLCFVELQAAGQEGEAAADRCFQSLFELVTDLVAELPDRQRPPQLVRALLAGVCKVLHTRLYRREEEELLALGPDLWAWMTSVEAPPSPLETPRRPRQPEEARFPGYTPAERITRAVAVVVAEKGFRAMNTGDIASEAAISLSTFYDHFTDKTDAVLAAIEMSGAQMMASAIPAARRADSWQDSVRTLYEAMCAYFVAEPALAYLATVGAYEAGPLALSRRDRVIDSLAEMLAPAAEENPAAPDVAAEAVAATVYALIREQVRKAGPQNLPAAVPLATYITLAGYVGPERACAVANGAARRR